MFFKKKDKAAKNAPLCVLLDSNTSRVLARGALEGPMDGLNMQINISFIYITLIGIIQIVLGNLMPKLRHNYTVGIKISWTLADPENWYHTHRVAGWSCVISGVLILATSLLMSPWLMHILVTAGIAEPIVYSFI